MFDSNNICFVCLSDRHELKKLFHNGIEYDIFKYVIPELVFPDLTNPMYICSSCHGDLRLFHVFKKKCIENYSRLKHYELILQRNYYSQDQDNKAEIVNYDQVEIQKSELFVELNIKEEQEESLLQSTEEHTSESKMIINDNEQYMEPKLEVNKNLNIQESNECSFMLVDEQIDVKDNIDIKEESIKSKCSLNQELQEFVKCESTPQNLQDAGPSLTSENNKNIDSNESEINGIDFFQCSYCGVKFCEERYLEKHLKAHLDKGVFECAFCKKKLFSIAKLKKHEKLHTEAEVVTDYFQCRLCSIKFSEKKYLEKHLKTHFGIKDVYECPICNRKLSSKINLKIHVRNHAEFKDVECSVCKRRYVQSAKNPECPTCKKKFAQICRLKHHRDVPLGSKYFKCSLCNKYVNL